MALHGRYNIRTHAMLLFGQRWSTVHSSLSVDQLCREGDFTYVHTRQGAYIKFPGSPLIEQLIADEGLQFEAIRQTFRRHERHYTG